MVVSREKNNEQVKHSKPMLSDLKDKVLRDENENALLSSAKKLCEMLPHPPKVVETNLNPDSEMKIQKSLMLTNQNII